MNTIFRSFIVNIILATFCITLGGNAHAHLTKDDREPASISSVPPEEIDEKLTKALHFEGFYLGEGSRVFSGGLKNDSNYLGLVDLRLSLDLDKAVGVKNTIFFLQLQAAHGGDPSKSVGDSQVSSNIETSVDTAKVYQIWMQKSFADNAASILFGVYDLNSEFYVTGPAGLFLNSSFGVGKELSQTGVNGPSIFPTPALAIRARAQVADSFYVQSAVFDAVAGDPEEPRGTRISYRPEDGRLFISEFGWLATQEGEITSKLAFGTWGYSRTFDDISRTDANDDPIQGASTGYYAIGEQNLTPALSLFLRYGEASDEVNRIKSNFSGGLTYKGLIPSRPEDQIGVAMTTATNGSHAMENAPSDETELSETAYELTYSVMLGKHLTIQPDYQYIQNPGTSSTTPDASVGALRFKIGF